MRAWLFGTSSLQNVAPHKHVNGFSLVSGKERVKIARPQDDQQLRTGALQVSSL
jgi:hypothetical protein